MKFFVRDAVGRDVTLYIGSSAVKPDDLNHVDVVYAAGEIGHDDILNGHAQTVG